MTKIIPEGRSGPVRIEHFKVSAFDSKFTMLRAIQHPDAYIPVGSYCRLYVGDSLMMSNTPAEQRTNFGVVRNSRGDVLIAGLGIGMILVPILEKREVKTVTVVEASRDVIELVEPSIRKVKGGKKLRVVEASIFDWQPPKDQKYDCIYFDIWATISTDTLKEMERLHRKFGRRKAPGGWMDSWKKDFLRLEKNRDRRARAWF